MAITTKVCETCKHEYEARRKDQRFCTSCSRGAKHHRTASGKVSSKCYVDSGKWAVARQKWRNSESGKASEEEYNNSERGQALRREATDRYQQSDKGKKTAAEYRHTDKYKATQKEWRESESGQESLRRAAKKHNATTVRKAGNVSNNKLFRERHPDKVRAQGAVSNAVRDGNLSRPDTCSNCSFNVSIVGPMQAHHHKGYEREFWLDIVWLCRRCHMTEHKKLRQT